MSTQPANDLADLRMRLVLEQETLMERKVRAYEASDTMRESHIDGQIVGMRRAMSFLDEIVRTERA